MGIPHSLTPLFALMRKHMEGHETCFARGYHVTWVCLPKLAGECEWDPRFPRKKREEMEGMELMGEQVDRSVMHLLLSDSETRCDEDRKVGESQGKRSEEFQGVAFCWRSVPDSARLLQPPTQPGCHYRPLVLLLQLACFPICRPTFIRIPLLLCLS